MLGRTSLAVAGALLVRRRGPRRPLRRRRARPATPRPWAPADKHGFATAHTSTGNAYLTLRQASLSEVYFPDLSTPAFRGLQFAVVDGGTATRETVDDDPRHIEPVADGVTAKVTPLPGALGFRQVTETRPLAADQDVDHRPGARDRARPRASSSRSPGRSSSSTSSPTRRRATTATTTAAAGSSPGTTTRRRAVAAVPRLKGATSGYRGTASDPWRRPARTRGKLRRYDGAQPGNVVPGRAHRRSTASASRR